MTTTLQAHGGGAQPASIDTSGKVAGGAAQRVYGFDSVEAAQAAGYVCEGGPAMSVALITDAQIASGAWKAEGDPAALVVYTAPSNMPVEGGYALPVYSVNGWGSAPAPAALSFDSAEIGAVNASTLVVTFSANVDASNYATGVTIKVNGTATSITSAIRQSDNHAKVNYLIPVLWHGSGDVVTWEYASGSGNIVAESDSTPLGDVSAQNVTNNCEYAAQLDLQSDTLALSDGDPVSTWADQSINGRDFTQAGDARPLKQTVGGYPVVVFDGVNDYLSGGNIIDDLASMTIFVVAQAPEPPTFPINSALISKYADSSSTWDLTSWGAYFFIQQTPINLNFLAAGTFNESYSDGVKRVIAAEVKSRAELHLYVNDVEKNDANSVYGTVTSYSNAASVEIAREGSGSESNALIYSILICSAAPSPANRAALEARLAARYGVTL